MHAAEQGIKWGDPVAGDPRLGADYGSFCAAWEDGVGHPTADLPNPDGHHSCGTLSTCDGLWSSYNYNADQAWCCSAWCYVNASTCDATAHGIDVARSWATTAEIYYSYGACSDAQYTAYTDDTCPYRSTMPGCECTGDNAALGAVELAKHGVHYGKYCAAWEDGKCTSCQTSSNMLGKHTCDGTHAASCEAHWPSYDFTQDQSWCCDSWCYVDNTTCTPELQAKYGITIADSWTGAELKYSYGACSDPFSAPQAHEAVDYNPQSFSQFDEHTCPYTYVADVSLDLPAWGRCEHAGCRLDHTWEDITDALVRGTMEAKIGGMGKLMNATYGVWLCAGPHWCAPDHGDHFCFVYHEAEHRFIPWGKNSELQLVTGEMEGTHTNAASRNAAASTAGFQLLHRSSKTAEPRVPFRRPLPAAKESTVKVEHEIRAASSSASSSSKARSGSGRLLLVYLPTNCRHGISPHE